MDKMKPIILFSGGIDSTALLVKAMNENLYPTLLHFKYNHPAAKKELIAVKKLHSQFADRCKLILHDIEILSTHKSGPGQSGSRFVRGRNLLFIATAINLSQLDNYDQIWVGATKSDHDNYYDCRPDFYYQLSFLIAPEQIIVTAPLIRHSRKEVTNMVNSKLLKETWSCYEPVNNNQCGTCDSCKQ